MLFLHGPNQLAQTLEIFFHFFHIMFHESYFSQEGQHSWLSHVAVANGFGEKWIGGGGGANEAIQKEMKKLRKKLEAIEKLKEKQKNGEELEKNQIEKLATEDDLRKQIEQLQL